MSDGRKILARSLRPLIKKMASRAYLYCIGRSKLNNVSFLGDNEKAWRCSTAHVVYSLPAICSPQTRSQLLIIRKISLCRIASSIKLRTFKVRCQNFCLTFLSYCSSGLFVLNCSTKYTWPLIRKGSFNKFCA